MSRTEEWVYSTVTFHRQFYQFMLEWRYFAKLLGPVFFFFTETAVFQSCFFTNIYAFGWYLAYTRVIILTVQYKLSKTSFWSILDHRNYCSLYLYYNRIWVLFTIKQLFHDFLDIYFHINMNYYLDSLERQKAGKGYNTRIWWAEGSVAACLSHKNESVKGMFYLNLFFSLLKVDLVFHVFNF